SMTDNLLFFDFISNSRYITFFSGIRSFIMPCREYPEKSFISFSPSANTLPVGVSAEGLRLWNPSAKWKCFSRFYFRRSGCSEGYFPAETFREVYPSAGMPTGRVFAEGLKDLKEK
ncbi:hypothetical protein, partial [Phocaeicola vulgatus]